MQPTVTRILHLEDSDLDADLIKSRLDNSPIQARIVRVSDRTSFVDALRQGTFDVILSDYQVPSFDGLSALELARQYQPETPFIFLSGAMGEELAVETLKRGATDYVLKERLARLSPAIERALAESRERAARQLSDHRALTILENITDGFLTLDRHWKINFLNGQAALMAGASRISLIGKDYREVFPRSLTAAVESELQQAMTRQQTMEFDARLEQDNRWLQIRAYSLPDGLAIYLKDVTDHKRAEESLRDSEARFRQLAETIPNMAWMARADGFIFWYNRRWYEFTGTALEDAEGWSWQQFHSPDYLPDVLKQWNHSLNTGEPFHMVFPLKGKDGEFRQFLTMVHPFRNSGEGIQFWFGTNTDITEQARAQDDLARSAEAEKHRAALLARVAEASRSINSVLSVESIVRILAEEARLTIGAHIAVVTHQVLQESEHPVSSVSLSPKYLGHRTFDIPRDGLAELVYRTNQPLRLTDQQVLEHQERRGADAPVSEIPLRGWVGVPLIGHGGANLGLIYLSDKQEGEFTAEDESVLLQLGAIASVGLENARLYERLREQERRKDEFLATLAHELRNPLAPLRTGLSVLKMSPGPESFGQAREMMERQVTHMVRLIDDLLDVSRITRGKVELRMERVSLNAILDAALEVSRPLVDGNGHSLHVSQPAETLYVMADLTRMAQVVSNLLNNAAKYTPNGGRIELAAERDGDYLRIQVQDNGMGIASDMLPKVFEMFTQVGRTLDRSQGGLGIGLALVTRLVEMHGGHISASSPGLGQGSTFVVRLPLAPARQQKEPAASPEIATPGPARQRRILVVDDNVDGAVSLSMLLKLSGHTTEMAYSGPSALEIAATFKPEIVFLDIGLPGLNGYEVARQLRSNPESSRTTLVALTGWGTEDDRREARNAGFDFHLTKPVEPAAVAAVLEQVK